MYKNNNTGVTTLRGRWVKVALVVMVSLLTTACFWENFSKSEKVVPELLHSPTDAADLVRYVKKATDEHKTIKMTGSGHSHSDVAVSEEFLLTPYKLDSVLALDRSRLKIQDDNLMVRVMSGIRIRELNKYLDSQELALMNLGGFDGQTIVGVAMTATHGSGLNYGPIASQILSMQVVGEGGQMFQVEPTEGITDALTFPGYLEENNDIPVTLIQDDTVFNAMSVSIGSMGIVYSVILKTDAKFWLHEVRTLEKWNDLKAPGGLLDRLMRGDNLDDGEVQPEYYELQYNPYPIDGDRTVLVTKRYKSYEKLKTSLQRGQPGTTFLSGLITLLEQPLSWLLNHFPSLAPALIEQSLKSQSDDGYDNISYKIFNIGIVNYTDAVAIEMAFDLQQTVEGIERAFEIADTFKQQGIVHSAPVAVRFVKPAENLIAMQYGRATTMLEIIIVQGVNGDQELLQTYEQTLMEEFSARPHWGLDVKILQGDEWAKKLYPRWDDWISIYQQFNSQGVFDGRVTDRLGISMRQTHD